MMTTGMGSSFTAPIAPALEREVSAGDNTRKSPIINTIPSRVSKVAVATSDHGGRAVRDGLYRVYCGDRTVAAHDHGGRVV